VLSFIQKVIEMPEEAARLSLNRALRDFSVRHRNISLFFKNISTGLVRSLMAGLVT
jgi:hypothetical protein